MVSEGIIDIFAAAGLKKPDISILSDEFLEDVKNMPHRNLAVEMLRKLIEGEIRIRSAEAVQSRHLPELENHRRYRTGLLNLLIIQELIELARNARPVNGEKLGLTMMR